MNWDRSYRIFRKECLETSLIGGTHKSKQRWHSCLRQQGEGGGEEEAHQESEQCSIVFLSLLYYFVDHTSTVTLRSTLKSLWCDNGSRANCVTLYVHYVPP